jgi:hypothetical protein
MSGLDTSQQITDQASLHADTDDEYGVHSQPERDTEGVQPAASVDVPDPDDPPTDLPGKPDEVGNPDPLDAPEAPDRPADPDGDDAPAEDDTAIPA